MKKKLNRIITSCTNVFESQTFAIIYVIAIAIICALMLFVDQIKQYNSLLFLPVIFAATLPIPRIVLAIRYFSDTLYGITVGLGSVLIIVQVIVLMRLFGIF